MAKQGAFMSYHLCFFRVLLFRMSWFKCIDIKYLLKPAPMSYHRLYCFNSQLIRSLQPEIVVCCNKLLYIALQLLVVVLSVPVCKGNAKGCQVGQHTNQFYRIRCGNPRMNQPKEKKKRYFNKINIQHFYGLHVWRQPNRNVLRYQTCYAWLSLSITKCHSSQQTASQKKLLLHFIFTWHCHHTYTTDTNDGYV